MADIAELIDEVANPDLRERLVREVKHLKATKRLGLVCERHFPEPVLLAGQPVRPGSSVRLRTEPDEEYEVSAVDGPTATIVPVENSRAGGGVRRT